jgi:carbonic anhydrase
MQSPVNIMLGEADAAAKAMPLAMDYRVLKNASIKNTGHGTQVRNCLPEILHRKISQQFI